MNTFSNAVASQKSAAVSRTENGMKAWATSDSKVLDLFGVIGSARGRDLSSQFSAALAEDQELAIRTLLWARDVRGGAGERGQFRNLLRSLEDFNPALAGSIMHKVPFLDVGMIFSNTKKLLTVLLLFACMLMLSWTVMVLLQSGLRDSLLQRRLQLQVRKKIFVTRMIFVKL